MTTTSSGRSLIWSVQLRGSNSNAEIQNAYFLPRVPDQGEVRFQRSSGGARPSSSGARSG
ncbi:hypothetical protein [Actinoplanes sp. G11-F43]|uniref:hypothetical protein n=1 Tax=Actinoplanes sp. G11-F43 TaxID=3424130 RepID=UPI003D34EE88